MHPGRSTDQVEELELKRQSWFSLSRNFVQIKSLANPPSQY